MSRAGDRTRTGDVQLGKQLNAHHKNPHSQAKSLCCNAQRRVPQLVSCGAFSSMWPKVAHRATRATWTRKLLCANTRAPPRNLTRAGDDNTSTNHSNIRGLQIMKQEKKQVHRSPEISNDTIAGREAAKLLDLPWPGTFNRVRRRLQIAQMLPGGERMWRVPTWGGRKLPGADWTYSREACATFALSCRASSTERSK